MAERIVTRGFRSSRRGEGEGRVPPGQHLEAGFPVLSAGPTPHTPLERWDFTVEAPGEAPRRWSWDEFLALPSEEVTADIHCVTSWTKLDTRWRGVPLESLMSGLEHRFGYLVAFCDGDYTTNLSMDDATGGKAWVVHEYDGRPLPPVHGGPARLLVPRLYFWKSAKWVRGLRLLDRDEPGFWETRGYHNRGDVWKEERYWNS